MLLMFLLTACLSIIVLLELEFTNEDKNRAIFFYSFLFNQPDEMELFNLFMLCCFGLLNSERISYQKICLLFLDKLFLEKLIS